VNPNDLVVSARLVAKLDGGTAHGHFMGQQVTTIELLAVRRNSVDLIRLVGAMNKPLAPTAAASCADDDDIALCDSPFALDTEQLRPKIEDEVVPFVVEGTSDSKPHFDRARSDLRLGERPLLVRRQHGQQPTRSVGRTVAQEGYRTV
jgi:hypothetical protein